MPKRRPDGVNFCLDYFSVMGVIPPMHAKRCDTSIRTLDLSSHDHQHRYFLYRETNKLIWQPKFGLVAIHRFWPGRNEVHMHHLRHSSVLTWLILLAGWIQGTSAFQCGCLKQCSVFLAAPSKPWRVISYHAKDHWKPHITALSAESPRNRPTTEPSYQDHEYVDKESYWVYMFYLLMVYKEREKNIDVPFSHTEQGWPLGEWLRSQRLAYKHGRIDSTREARLEEAGIAWDLQAKHWETMFKVLRAYVAREGHAHVPQEHIEQGRNLGNWIHTQRSVYRSGKLTKRRQEQLETLGLVWNRQDATWEHWYVLLKKFHSREGHANVPVSYKNGGEQLGAWLASQRKFWRQGTLKLERQRKLVDLGVQKSINNKRKT